MKTVVFLKNTYVEKSGMNIPEVAIVVADLSLIALCELYNLVTTSVGGKRIKGFKDKPTGVVRAWKALIEWEATLDAEADEDAGDDTTPAKPKAVAPVESEAAPKSTNSSRARTIKRLTRRMCRTITKVKAPKKEQRLKFWDNYETGMTLRSIIETEGLDPAQVGYWISLKCIKVEPVTEEAYTAALEIFNA